MWCDTAATPAKRYKIQEISCDTCSATGGTRNRVQLREARFGLLSPQIPLLRSLFKHACYQEENTTTMTKIPSQETCYADRYMVIRLLAFQSSKKSGQVRPRQGTDSSAISGRRLHWRLSTGFFAFSPVFMCNLVRRAPKIWRK